MMCFAYIVYQKLHHRSQVARLKGLLKQLTEPPDTPDKVVDQTLPLHERIEQLPYDQKYEIRKDNIIPDKVSIFVCFYRNYTTRVQ